MSARTKFVVRTLDTQKSMSDLKTDDWWTEFGSYHDTYTIEIRPLTKCNYNCYYCTDNRINSNPIINLNVPNINKMILSIKQHLKKKIKIYIVGGEPTLYPKLHHFVNELSKHLTEPDYIEIQTNLSKSIPWFKKFNMRIHRPEVVKISVSYHNTQETNFKRLLDKCIYLKQINMLGIVTVMYNIKKHTLYQYKILRSILGVDACSLSYLVEPRTHLQSRGEGESPADILTEEVKYIAKNENICELKELSPDYFADTLSYKSSTGDWKKISKFDLWLERKNDFSGHRCDIEVDCIFIDWNGDCYKCPNDQFSSVPPVMNIQQDVFECDEYYKNLSSIICPYTWCCPFGISKHKKYRTQDTETQLIPANRKYNTAAYKYIKP